MEETDKQPFQFEDHVAFKQKKGSGRCAKCCVCFCMFLAVLLAFLCVAAVVAFGILYWQLIINESVMALEDRIVELEMQLNESQSAMMPGETGSQLSQAMAAVQNLEARVNQSTENLTTQINQGIATVNNEITSQVGQVRADFNQEVTNINGEITNQVDQVRTDVTQAVSTAQSTTYIRWGHNSCPSVSGTTQIYNGKIGGASFAVTGTGANYLCMPFDPEYTLPHIGGTQASSLIYGAEYQFPNDARTDEDIPCSVCSVSTRSQMIMIPAKASCPNDWTVEYLGYIMSEHLTRASRTSFICVDQAFQPFAGAGGHQETGDMWLTEASCASFDCGAGYDGERELNCAVCTK